MNGLVPDQRRLVVIADGVTVTQRANPADEMLRDTPSEPKVLSLPLGLVLTIVSVTKMLPMVATVHAPLVEGGGSIALQLPVSTIRRFAVPVMVPRAQKVRPQ